MYKNLRASGKFNYETVNAMFDNHQNAWPEALKLEDSNYKYIQPYIENGEDRLAMCLGFKKEQRKFWLYNRFKYIDSKYNAGDAAADSVSMRSWYTPASGETYGISITPYADIYATVLFGVAKSSVRTARNTTSLVPCSLDHMEFTDTYIYSASQIKDFGDLSVFKPDAVEFSRAVNAQSLKFGDGASSYTNPNMKSLSLGNNVKLKVLDIRNCINLGADSQKTLDLSGCRNIEEVYADGTALRGITLPSGGILKKIHYPGTLQNLTVMNQKFITEFVCPDYTNITTLRIENSASVIPTKTILNAISASARVRLIGFAWEAEDAEEIEALFDKLDLMRGLDEQGNTINVEDGGCHSSVSGTIHTTSLTGAEIAAFNARYPYITVSADYTESTRTFKTWDGSSVVGTVTCLNGVAQSAAPNVPNRDSTAQYNYTAVGWATTTDSSTADYQHDAVTTADVEYYAAYSRAVRSYTITWKNSNGTTLKTETKQYGSTPNYGGTPTDPSGAGLKFKGWNPAITTVKANATYTAVYASSAETFDTPGFDVSDAYAVQWHYDLDSPNIARGGLAASFTSPSPATSVSGSGSSPFDNIQPWAGMKEVNILSDGTVIEKNDSRFSYTDNDVMVYIPEFWYCSEKDAANTRWTWAISPTAKTGYKKHPGSGRYVSKYHTTGTSSALTSRSGGNPLANLKRSDYRTKSKAKGSGWEMIDLATWSAIQMLYLVEYANFDSQTVLGTGQDSGSVMAAGGTNGAAYHTIKASKAHNAYRWIEDPYSNVYDFVDGFVASEKVSYVGTDSSKYSDTVTGLTNTNITLPGPNYISGFGYNESADWAFVPDTSQGSSVKYVRDYVYSSSGVRVLYVGGSYSSGALCGFFYFFANYGASSADSGFGSRLLFH